MIRCGFTGLNLALLAVVVVVYSRDAAVNYIGKLA